MVSLIQANVHLRYRCKAIFVRMTKWLRQRGVKDNKPLRTLRKEFGSQICAAHDIHAASRQLRHADIAITNMFYTDARNRALTGLGHLLKPDDKVVPLSAGNKPDTTTEDLAQSNYPQETETACVAESVPF